MALHVFAIMPFGTKEGIDFDKVYRDYIMPALGEAGFDVFRADQEMRAGEILADMFQELLLADLVVADLSIDNPNVWYELGVRHALRARGIILIQGERKYQPFDIYTDRKLRYHIKEGVPDEAFLQADKKALALMAKETIASWHGRKISPVYHYLPYLKENEWKTLRVGEVNEFWEKHEHWERRIRIAEEKMRPGDIIVLADEAPVQVLRLEAHRRAGKALTKLGQFAFALEQFEKALALNPEDLESQQQKGILLGRLKKFGEAKVHLEDLVSRNPESAETLALLGRVEKDKWVNAWRKENSSPEEMKTRAADEDAVLRDSVNDYVKGYKLDPGHYYSAINAVTLIRLLHDLTGDESLLDQCKMMEGGIRWCIESDLSKETPAGKNYWARVTLGDLVVLSGDSLAVKESYKRAVAAAGNDWFKLDSSLQQLLILRDLGFRPEQVREAVDIFTKSLDKIKAPWQPQKVFLFSGHMIDVEGRKPPRFPAKKEKIAIREINRKLDELGASSGDLAICGGACGGDLIFAEACLERGMRLEVRISFDEPMFLNESVTFAGDLWRDRYLAVKQNALTSTYVMPEELGPLPVNSNPYERNNLWQLSTALSWGADKVYFICLWDRKGGDGPGGTKHMFDEVNKRSGHVYVLDTNIIFKEE